MVTSIVQKPPENGLEERIMRALGHRSIVLWVWMGSVNHRSAAPPPGWHFAAEPAFCRLDTEIESAAGMIIAENFSENMAMRIFVRVKQGKRALLSRGRSVWQRAAARYGRLYPCASIRKKAFQSVKLISIYC